MLQKGTQGEFVHVVNAYMAWNLLDMPAGIVPVSKVTEDDDYNLNKFPSNELVRI